MALATNQEAEHQYDLALDLVVGLLVDRHGPYPAVQPGCLDPQHHPADRPSTQMPPKSPKAT